MAAPHLSFTWGCELGGHHYPELVGLPRRAAYNHDLRGGSYAKGFEPPGREITAPMLGF